MTYENMEKQTVSISKAGIHAILNASCFKVVATIAVYTS